MALVNFSLNDIGDLFKDIRAAITGKEVLDPNKQLELIQKLNEVEARYIEAQSKIIEAEAKSEHWITSAWRPITALVFVFIIANNYIIVPYLKAFGLNAVPLELTPEMWELLKIMIGGYVIGRSVEKTAKYIKGE